MFDKLHNCRSSGHMKVQCNIIENAACRVEATNIGLGRDYPA